VYQLFTDFKKAYDSIRKEVLSKIIIEFDSPTNLVRLIKMCPTEKCVPESGEEKICLTIFQIGMV
jgi:hypothetical protein